MAPVGHTEGHSISQIAVGLKGPNGKVVPLPGMQDLDFRLDFKGTTYGMGTTTVGGVGNWFTVLDANYTQTRFDILDGSIDALTFRRALAIVSVRHRSMRCISPPES